MNVAVVSGAVVSLLFVISGAKELDLAATVEHLRDSRPCMVRTKVGVAQIIILGDWSTDVQWNRSIVATIRE